MGKPLIWPDGIRFVLYGLAMIDISEIGLICRLDKLGVYWNLMTAERNVPEGHSWIYVFEEGEDIPDSISFRDSDPTNVYSFIPPIKGGE